MEQRNTEANNQSIEKDTLNEINEIWKWTSKLREIRKIHGNKKAELLKVCQSEMIRFDSKSNYQFPSKIVEGIAYEFEHSVIAMNTTDEVKETIDPDERFSHQVSSDRFKYSFHNENTFPLYELTDYIIDHKGTISENNVDDLIVMLIDIGLYKAYETLSGISSGRLIFQLNACIILDAMILKPDISSRGEYNDLSLLLRVVVEKADSRMDMLDANTVWTIAMLNYKTQRYGRARRYFERYISLINRNAATLSSNADRNMYAKIAIGYCFEKIENSPESDGSEVNDHFSRAISHFNELLEEMQSIKADSSANDGGVNTDKLDDYIIELHHGLGHFYNERAVFGRTQYNPTHDILSARKHMRYALNARPEEFASCYGSLFYEYRDYGAALDVFNSSMKNRKLRDNEELRQELLFYTAQSETLYSDAENQDADDKLLKFEKYCRTTFNYDGIIHARIFRCRAYMQRLPFTDRSPNKLLRKEKISHLYDDLTELSLSNYAAMSIRREYDKAKFMLRVYRSLYWDDDFVWRMEDIQYNLEKLIALMPQSAQRISHKDLINTESRQTNLYIISVSHLDIWCITDSPFPSVLLRKNGGIVDSYVAVSNSSAVYHEMEFSGNTNYIVVIPPVHMNHDEHLPESAKNNPLESVTHDNFEREILSIKSSRGSLCFILPRRNEPYDQTWVHDNFRGWRRNITSMIVESDKEAIQYAFCFRAFSIMRNELLQPMPLFTLVPTHLSLAYDYQQGEPLDLLIEEMQSKDYLGLLDTSVNPLYWRLGEAYKQRRNPVNQNVFEFKRDESYLSKLSENLNSYAGMVPCINRAVLTICCPEPIDEYSDTFLSYRVTEPDAFKNLVFSQIVSEQIDSTNTYRIKAMKNYSSIYFALRDALELCRTCKENCETYGLDECSLYCSGQKYDDDVRETIENKSIELLRSILSGKTQSDSIIEISQSELNKNYRCVLRQTIEDAGQAIYIMLLDNSVQDKASNNTKTNNMFQRTRDKRADMELRDFFISYNNKSDEAKAEWIANTLMESGHKVYFQKYDCGPSMDFPQWMAEAINHAKNFVAVWSKAYENSDYCKSELNAAFVKQRSDNQYRLLPIRVENTPIANPLIARIVHIDILSSDDEENRSVLLSALEKF